MIKPKKLLVWDGDDTLWRGTLTAGDKIALPPGRLDLCKDIAAMGGLQSVASRNLLQDVEDALHRFGLSQLFLANRADMTTGKGAMVKQIMDDLGLVSPADVLFVDDNVHNTAEVSFYLDGIDTLNVADDEAIRAAFYKASYTEEDRNRVAMYRSELRRKQASAAYQGSKTDFLYSLDMRATIREARPGDMPRVEDLVHRSHQLAAAERDYGPDDLWQAMQSGWLHVLEAEDKYGSYGISGVCLREIDSNGDGLVGAVKLLVISCRLQGKGYGSALLGHMVNTVAHMTCLPVTVRASWLVTKYNGEVRGLFDWYKFVVIQEGNRCLAVLRTMGVSLPPWIYIT